MNAPNAFFLSIIDVAEFILGLYIWVLIIGAVLSWLIAFNVINTRNRFVEMTLDFINRVTEPLLAPIRRVIPPAGGLDLSPLVLIFIIYFLQHFLARLAYM